MIAGRRAARAHNYGRWVLVLLCAESHISLAHGCFLTVRSSNSAGFSQFRGQASRCDLHHTRGKLDWSWSDEFCRRPLATTVRKKPPPAGADEGFYYIYAWQCPTLTWGDPTLPSALSVFTSECEMGSGGSRSLWPPGKPVGVNWGQTRFSLSGKLYAWFPKRTGARPGSPPKLNNLDSF